MNNGHIGKIRFRTFYLFGRPIRLRVLKFYKELTVGPRNEDAFYVQRCHIICIFNNMKKVLSICSDFQMIA